ncbi:hypothetical protein FRC07_005199 [Ceratobasidium sp. 392]|nr:hypothetical protein FRC07_005199 [Ceratobasidium sp. 392]
MSLLEQARHRREQQDHRASLPPLHPPLPSIHTFAPLPAPVARPAGFSVAHRTQDGKQAYDYGGDLHETSGGAGYSYYSSSQTPAPRDPMFRPRPSFPITIAPAQPHAPPRPHPPPSRKFVHPPATYVPPAHPHSHHLHSIPPRDKSTRTLILDHLLWMHARARFGAARGELGVGTRPHLDAKDACLETLEDHGVMGLGLFEEGLDKLSYSSRAQPPPVEQDPDALTLGPPDLALAAAYRAKATGLEKVLTAMLDQTPQPDPGHNAEDDMVIDSGLSTSPGSSRSVIPSQKLPNSVRLRLALSLLANELFSPEPEPAAPAQTTSTPPTLLSLSQLASPPPPSFCPPSPPVTTLPSFHQLTSGAPPHPQSIFQTIPRGQGPEGPWTYPRTGAPGPSISYSTLFRDGVVDDPLGVRPEDGPSNGSNGIDIISTGGGTRSTGTGRTMSTTEERELAAYDAREKALAAMYDPDEMPTLAEAGRILFNRESSGEEEDEWEREVRNRLVEFTSVPHDAPGLGAHLEAIAERYPAEPVERAALRFCESVAKWRGKPELETYKKPVVAPASSPGPSIPIDQLINIPLSATPRPPIERYFHLPVLTTLTWRASDSTPTNSKRPRAHDETSTNDREAKKVNVASGPGYVEEDEWVGPYGL